MLKNIFFVLLVLINLGASDKDANKKNFTSAIQKYLDASYPKCYVYGDLPLETSYSGMRKEQDALLKLFSEQGLLKKTEIERQEIGGMFGGAKELVIRYSYTLTEKGKEYYKTNAL